MGTTLAARMQWILANKKRPGGDPWDAKALSIASGLGNSHVGQIANSKLTSPNLRTLKAIARTAGVLTMSRGGRSTCDARQRSGSAAVRDRARPLVSKRFAEKRRRPVTTG